MNSVIDKLGDALVKLLWLLIGVLMVGGVLYTTGGTRPRSGWRQRNRLSTASGCPSSAGF